MKDSAIVATTKIIAAYSQSPEDLLCEIERPAREKNLIHRVQLTDQDALALGEMLCGRESRGIRRLWINSNAQPRYEAISNTAKLSLHRMPK